MPRESNHLQEIVKNHNRTANLKVVFLDIAKYSKRRTTTQIQVIDALTQCMVEAIKDLSADYAQYARDNQVDFFNDIAKVPTGDGAALMFSFDGLHDIHLRFAKSMLRHAALIRAKNPCPEYDEKGWCNCHPGFSLRIGVSEGKGVVYLDVNGNYNVAGAVINLADRVMGLVDPDQIGFTEEAYREIVDQDKDPRLPGQFRMYRDVKIKHDEKITVYQFLGDGEEYINAEAPENLVTIMDLIERIGKNFPTLPSLTEKDANDQFGVHVGLNKIDVFFNSLANSITAPGPADTKQSVLIPPKEQDDDEKKASK